MRAPTRADNLDPRLCNCHCGCHRTQYAAVFHAAEQTKPASPSQGGHQRTLTGWEGGGYPVHLMAGTELSADGRDHTDLARHFAIEVESLREVAKTLLSHGLRPFQSGFEIKERRDVTAAGDLSYGIGTIFVDDPDGNIVEFVQTGQGIYGKYL